MPRYFARCAYDGTNYSGWQIQPNSSTVQETIEKGLSVVIRKPISIVGCGRTDAGVHASDYVFHFDTNDILDESIIYSIKSILPNDIVIYNLINVADDKHARYDALSRKYKYQLRIKRSPFQNKYFHTMRSGKSLDIELLDEAANFILNLKDFEAFSKKGSDVNHHLCNVMESYWEGHGDHLNYYIKANRFLRGMVRLIVGMQVNYAKGKFTLEEVRDSINKTNTIPMNYSIPGNGLFLKEIKYDFFS